ncbi:glycosyltransferase [Pectobacterium parmentieri]|uniref:glycosyltransferase n=1 Tax=Pectobacterium parmentieri TaxID=1905730 RepID=UPI00051A46D7|nr:glycosyltransferase [Pectobacterium parmentieri]AOR57983.1 amylovoran biosynthesis protein AmsE [Pectobacterium parmentieri]AYH37282.1 amylovoran biosynthesis protein AmsE [Pectobacterium parmentieri]AZS57511.1 amylovoran biosynthesis protein AmsE [Pectobacterium parmentieri]MBI0428601.1 glycosyltransferase [Pectobacterium parmentieri]
MREEDFFSVLMSIYKNETPDNFNDSLNSLFCQTLKPAEVVIVVDGPVDNAIYEVIEKWRSSLNLVVKKIKSNVGLGNALNFGLNFCSHELIARMDTDDISLPDRFFKQINFMSINPSIAILGANVEEYDRLMQKSLGFKNVPSSYNEILSFSKKRNPFNHMSVVFRKSVILSVGGYRDHLLMEDYNLWLRVIATGHHVKNLEDTLLSVRVDSNSLVRRKGFLYIKSEIKLAKLKVELGIQDRKSSFFTFIFRCVPRLLPKLLLTYIYKINRKKTVWRS